MFCSKCGNELKESVLFCPTCGNDLKGKSTSENEVGIKDLGFILLSVPVLATILLLMLNASDSLTTSLTTIILFSVLVVTLLIVIYEVTLNEPDEHLPWLRWVFYFVLFWIVGYPSYFSDRTEYGYKRYTVVASIIAISFVATFFLVSTNFGQSLFNKDVELVKSGVLQTCPNSSVEQMVSSFFANPKWEAGKSDEGLRYVNISGDMTVDGNPASAMLQFQVDKDKTFKFQALEIGGTPQNLLTSGALLVKMCEATQHADSKEETSIESPKKPQNEDVDLKDKDFWGEEDQPMASPADASPADAAK